MQKYSIWRILKEKFNQKYFWDYPILPVKAGWNMENTWWWSPTLKAQAMVAGLIKLCLPILVDQLPCSAPQWPKEICPEKTRRRLPKFNVRDMPETHDRLQISCQILTAPLQWTIKWQIKLLLELSYTKADTPPDTSTRTTGKSIHPLMKKGKKVTDLRNRDDNPEKSTLREPWTDEI